MSERRFREEEVRKIFKLATTDKVSDPLARPAATGLTLNEMQSIGLEVGIEPALVARAAATFDAQPVEETRTSLGVPVRVGLTVPLARDLSNLEWDQLVAELRRTFNAQGKITSAGTLREWRNSNLHASVEPVGAGYRLRLGTTKGNAMQMNAVGATVLIAAAVMFATHFMIGDPLSLAGPISLAVAGIGAFVANWIRLPPWARRREAQMRHVAATAQSIVAGSNTEVTT